MPQKRHELSDTQWQILQPHLVGSTGYRRVEYRHALLQVGAELSGICCPRLYSALLEIARTAR